MLGHCQSRKANPHAGTRGFIHLAVAESHLGFGEVVGIDNPRFLEFLVEVIAFTSAFAYASKYRNTTMLFGDVIDQFLNKNRLANAGTTKKTNLATLAIRSE